MVAPSKIRVMISSRCNDSIKFRGRNSTLSAVRHELKRELEEIKLLGSQLFEVWINEDAVPAPGDEDAWEHCMDQVKRADVLIGLYNGNAGWAKGAGSIGICHAELETAFNTAPAKVRIVEIEPIDEKLAAKKTHALFQTFYATTSRFRGESAKNGEEVIERAKQALREAVADMVHLGLREAKKGKFAFGESLDWSKLDFTARSSKIRTTIIDTLANNLSGTAGDDYAMVSMGGEKLQFVCHGMAASMSVSAARELVGQPFVKDYDRVAAMNEAKPKAALGPIHLIGCHRSVTESQATKLLGLSDCIVVSPSFGVYLVDPISKTQIVFISNCRDEMTTRDGVQRFLDWLDQSGESQYLVQRAKSRKKILNAIASEIDK